MADNRIEILTGSKVIFADAGYTGEDVEISVTSLANATGRVSARWEVLDGTSHPARLLIGGEFQCQATPSQGQSIRVYACWHSEDGDDQANVGNVDAAFTADQARNAEFISFAEVETSTADKVFTVHPKLVEVKGRYLSLAVYNDSGATLTADDTENFLWVYPFPYSIE